MREPELLPEWYVRDLRRSDRRRAVVRVVVAGAVAGALCVAAWAQLRPRAAAASPLTVPSAAVASRNCVAAGAGAGFTAIRELVPPELSIASISVGGGGGRATFDLQCLGEPDAVERFAAALRGSATFRDIQVTAPALDAGELGSGGRTRLNARHSRIRFQLAEPTTPPASRSRD